MSGAIAPIFLTGFMGSGKSRIGRELAARLDRPFVDLDREIERRIGPITPFFMEQGEQAFREVERDVLGSFLSKPDMIMAAGGGTPFFFDNMERMQQAGTVIFLEVPLDILQERLLRTGRDRPLLFAANDEELRQRVRRLHHRRLPGHRRAQIHVDANAAPDVVVDRILSTLHAS